MATLGGKESLLDVTTISLNVSSAGNHTDPLFVAKSREDQKCQKYKWLAESQNCDFVPIVFEIPTGGMGDAAKSWMHKVSGIGGPQKTTSHELQCDVQHLQAAFHRGLANCAMGLASSILNPL